jgi:hypothetical protein
MASVTATYVYGGAEGDTVSVDVVIENDYPDALSEARKTAVAGIRELTGMNDPIQVDVDPDA